MNSLLFESDALRSRIEFYRGKTSDINNKIIQQENDLISLEEKCANAQEEMQRSEDVFARITS